MSLPLLVEVVILCLVGSKVQGSCSSVLSQGDLSSFWIIKGYGPKLSSGRQSLHFCQRDHPTVAYLPPGYFFCVFIV